MVPGDGLLLMDESISVRWHLPNSKKYQELSLAAHGCYGGTPLLEITKEGKIVKRGFLYVHPPIPNSQFLTTRRTQTVTPARYSFWKEVRNYKNYMLIGSEREGHGVQIFDMTKVNTTRISARGTVANLFTSSSASRVTTRLSSLMAKLEATLRRISSICSLMDLCTTCMRTRS